MTHFVCLSALAVDHPNVIRSGRVNGPHGLHPRDMTRELWRVTMDELMEAILCNKNGPDLKGSIKGMKTRSELDR